MHDPLYTDDELAGSGSRRTTSASRSTLPSCRPTTPSTAALWPADLPGLRAFIDGRRVSSPEVWGDIVYRVIGRA